MSFRITGLSPEPFRHLFGLSDEQLREYGAIRYIVDEKPGFPDRIGIRDAEPGESVLLVNYTHQPADTPYRASHAIFIAEGASETYDRVDEIPEVLRVRLISLRVFDSDHLMLDADVVDGRELEGAIERFFTNPRAAYIQAHYAKRGCYAARIERA
ncbi:MAG TPA: DUF1203 domain-containing protein [Povalibacter sp.]|nr:DUF1203 domain-containing protein [Povalibacter sp.]